MLPQRGNQQQGNAESAEKKSSLVPSISMPKGGGAIRGIDEKFSVNPVTGTGSLSVPIFTSPGRSGFSPKLSLSYDSGAGNGPFGLGWNLSIPSITRKTDKGVPKYQDAEESDTFILSGAEDLVPLLEDVNPDGPSEYTISRYRPRIEGLFARIENWEHKTTGEVFWKSISKDNITSFYGKSDREDVNSRIADPDDETRVFKWLLEESYDDKGNVILYEYKPENEENIDPSSPQEKNRIGKDYANRYLKRVKYGNTKPRSENPDPDSDYLFEVVFDYGEHDKENPAPDDDKTQTWKPRQDAFSSYRAGFEIRTQRLCRRVLMFHHFKELGDTPCLVRSTDFSYQESPIISYLATVTQTGYVKKENAAGYNSKPLPPLEFSYTKAEIDETIHCIEAESLENLPVGLDGGQYQWIDLDGEGISGILTEQGNAWFYKRNLSPIPVKEENGEETIVARFAPLERVATKPSPGALQNAQIMDLAGDGQKDLVLLDAPLSGFYERTEDGCWNSFVPFTSFPNVRWNDPNLRFVDLNGDGHADVLVTEDEVFTWYPSEAEHGFGPSERVPKAYDEEQGPTLVFADVTQSVYLADISGDGLSDIVRIRNGDVCYWPNLGYGRFGAKVTMDTAPYFDSPDLFDQKRVRLADIDGSGTTDIIYLGSNIVSFWYNQSGNSWSPPYHLTNFPKTDNLSSVTVVDLLGKGTACIVWSSPLPGESQQPMRYIDLMSQGKPHLLESTKNNLGAETKVQYAPSTKFYLEDLEARRPWTTRLPFPVHVLERVETYDRISRNHFVSRYAYHHGYFDGIEREFRGFGLVEQWDTEEFAALSASDTFPIGDNIDQASHVPPVLTKTWFHPGAYQQGQKISKQFEDEYYRESDQSEGLEGLSDEQFQAMLLDDTVLPDGLTTEEAREACRALKGRILRQEIYALDDSPQSPHPYTVSERNYELILVQPMLDNRHAVFYAYPHETIDFHYERHPDDPRVTHQISLKADEYGNITDSVAIAYPRRDPQFPEQAEVKITYNPVDFINKTDEDDWYYVGIPYQNRSYEITGISWSWSDPPQWLTKEAFDTIIANPDSFQPYEWQRPKNFVGAAKRIIEWDRSYFRQDAGADELDETDDLAHRLRLGEIESLGLPYESYRAAFTDNLLQEIYAERVTDAMMTEGKYFREPDQPVYWWIPSGRQAFKPESFYLPHKSRDPFGNVFHITYDEYALLIESTVDPLGNTVQVENDYRVLQPWQMTDPNGNRSEVVFDTLGLVVGTAVMGKIGESEGDLLTDDFKTDPGQDEIETFFTNPEGAIAKTLLDKATTRIIYDVNCYFLTGDPNQPPYAATLARERHLHQSEASPIQINFSYSDGFGREIQKKIQAEPGPIEGLGEHIDPRWVGSGWTVFNNKGKPVRQYEPFFSQLEEKRHRFEFGVTVGVSPILFYDPVERVVVTLHPNHTYEKVVFDPWQQTTYEVNDTVLGDPRTDPDIAGFVREYFETQPETWQTWYMQRQDGALGAQEQAAAQKTAVHADTPTIAHFDVLGRPFLSIADNGVDENGQTQLYETRVELDIEGNQRKVIDAKGRVVMRYDYYMAGPDENEEGAGNLIHQASMEAGERWILNDVAGNPIRAWDSRNHQFSYTYDELRRPASMHVSGGDGNTLLNNFYERIQYGDWKDMTPAERAQNEQANRIGQPFEHYDTAGKVLFENYDFKGNLKKSTRRLVTDYENVVNWSGENLDDFLENEAFSTETKYDALNRVVETKTPDGSITVPTYNEANLLNAVDVNLRGEQEGDQLKWTSFVTNIDYNAKGQRELIEYANNTQTEYTYDDETFRLINLTTTQTTDNKELQNLSYTYDPVGNITHICDDAQQTIYFDNHVVKPENDYIYDAIYRLIGADGREHIGQVSQPQTTWNDEFRTNLPHPGDSQAMRRYTELYHYDEVGNIEEVAHKPGNLADNLVNPSQTIWKRTYTYNEPSLIPSAPGHNQSKNNRLSSTTVNGITEEFTYDTHGNMKKMPHLPTMEWDFKDQLQALQRQVINNGKEGENAYYVYDAAGQRVRKVIVGQNGVIKKERIYLDGFEIYREYNGSEEPKLTRETLHIMDDQQRIALVETKTHDPGTPPNSDSTQVIRYQFGNHLGSASLELDDAGAVISYEEYYPYGSTSYQSGRSMAEVGLKRYRYTGKERDEESGLYYHGARYYAPWLGRWCSCDPDLVAFNKKENNMQNQLRETSSLLKNYRLNKINQKKSEEIHTNEYIDLFHYCYVANNPIIFIDPDGRKLRIVGTEKEIRRVIWALDYITHTSLEYEKKTFGKEITATITGFKPKNPEEYIVFYHMLPDLYKEAVKKAPQLDFSTEQGYLQEIISSEFDIKIKFFEEYSEDELGYEFSPPGEYSYDLERGLGIVKLDISFVEKDKYDKFGVWYRTTCYPQIISCGGTKKCTTLEHVEIWDSLAHELFGHGLANVRRTEGPILEVVSIKRTNEIRKKYGKELRSIEDYLEPYTVEYR